MMSIREGEKGIAILAPITARRDVDAVDGESKTVVGFRAAYVFDVAQTDGALGTSSGGRMQVLIGSCQ